MSNEGAVQPRKSISSTRSSELITPNYPNNGGDQIHISSSSLPSLSRTDNNHQFDQGDANLNPTCETKPLPVAAARSINSSFLRSWWLEIGSIVISIFNFLATIAILAWSNNKPLSIWSAHLSINTVVSILTTASRTTLAFAIATGLSQQKWNFTNRKSVKVEIFESFDQASRGPGGALLFILKLGFRQSAVLGAFVTVLFLPFDPFVQNAISFPIQMVKSTDSASSSKLIRLDIGEPGYGDLYSPPTGGIIPDTPKIEWFTHPLWSDDNKPDPGVTIAVTEGFTNLTQSNPALSVSCGTGNCIWPKYKSLGVCSSCTDISTHIVKNRRVIFNNPSLSWEYSHLSGDSESAETEWGISSDCVLVANLSVGEPAEGCPTLTPDGMSVRLRNYTFLTNPLNETVTYSMTFQLPTVELANKELALFNATQDTIMAFNATSLPEETFNFRNLTTMISAFTSIKAHDSYLQGKSVWNATLPSATECALFFCVNEYTLKMANYTLEQDVKPATFERNFASYGNSSDLTFWNQSLWAFQPPTLYNLTAEEIVRFWFASNALWHHEGTIFKSNATLGSLDLQLISRSTNADTEAFNVSANTTASLIQYILSWSVGQLPLKLDRDDTHPFLSRTATPNEEPQNILMNALFASPNISLTFANAAQSISNYIQNTTTSGGAIKVPGTSMIAVTHIIIQWGFLALPGFTLLAGYVYVILVLLQTWRLDTPPWKEKLSPLLSSRSGPATQGLTQDLGASDKGHCETARLTFEDNTDGDKTLRLIKAT